jgi:hypothetical protein
MNANALRDALGFARLLYAVEADVDRRAAVAAAGEQLATALRFAEMEPGSLGHRRAPVLAREAADRLRAVGWSAEVTALVEASRSRIK